jgi:hypothetical protein
VNERKPRYPAMTRSGGLYWMRIRGNCAHDPLSCASRCFPAYPPERIPLAEAPHSGEWGLGPVRARESGPRGPAIAHRELSRFDAALFPTARWQIRSPASGYRVWFAPSRVIKFEETRLGFKINARLCCTCSFISRLSCILIDQFLLLFYFIP